MAAKMLIRPDFALLNGRGLVEDCPIADKVIATVHPAYLLRLPSGANRDAEIDRWLADLKLAATYR